MAVGIEKLKAAMVGLEALSGSVGDVMEDGKVSLGDITKLPSIISQAMQLFADGKAAVDAGELQDIDLAEAQELLRVLIEMGAKIFAQFKVEA